MALSWSLVSAPSTSLGRAICWSPDLQRYAAFGDIAMFSDDGINWSEGNAPDYHATTNFVAKNGIIWNPFLQLFIAICRDNSSFSTILTSPDGENWTTRTSSIVLQNGIGFETVTGFTIIVGNDGAVTGSADGITWASIGADLVSLGATTDWQHILWVPSASQYVAVASNGNIRIATSPDGISWTGRHGFNPSYQLTWTRLAVKTGDDLVVCCGGSNGRFFMKSEDGGTTWDTPYLIPAISADSTEALIVIWSEILNLFVLLIDNDTDQEGQVYTSPDAAETNWTLDSLIPDTTVVSGSAWEWQALAEAPDLDQFVAGQENGSDEPFATAVSGAVDIIGDLSLEIEDDSVIASPNEIVGDLELAIMLTEVHEIIGDLTLEIELAPVTVWSADASGLYILVPGKTDDTIYAREHVEETQDVAIPDPTLGTAYVGG